MKKALLLCPMLALVALAGMPGTVSANSLPISSDWVVTSNGAEPTAVFETDKGYMMNHVNDYGETGYFNKLIPLDGLSFDIRAENIHNADTFGFYLSKTKATGNIVWTTPTITIWKGLYGSQTRFSISNSHDYNGASSKAHVDKSLESSKDIGAGGQADEGVFNNNSDMTSAGFHIAFAKCDEEWYSINVRALDSQESWGNNANYNASDKSFTAYIPLSYMTADGIDAEGKTYLHYTGFRSSANKTTTDQTIYIENLVYTRSVEEVKQEALDEINAVMLEEYDEADRTIIEEARATALQELEAATTVEEAQAAYDKFQQVLDSHLTATQKYLNEIYQNAPEALGVMDEAANFKDFYNYGYSATKLNDDGGFVARVLPGYGQRGVIKEKYDPRNFEINLNFAKAPVDTTGVFTISNDEGGYINDPNAVIYGMDIVKLEEERFFLTLTNEGSHNLSVEGFNSETWHGNYTGRYVNAPRGDIHIKVTTVGNVTTFTVNDVSVELDATLLFKNFVGENSWLSLGVMSCVQENTLVAVTKIVDAPRIEKANAIAEIENLSTKFALNYNYSDGQISNVKVRFGATISEETWNVLKDSITEYGVIATQSSKLSSPTTTMKAEFQASGDADIISFVQAKGYAIVRAEGNTPDVADGKVVFQGFINVPNNKLGVDVNAVAYIKIDGEYLFLGERENMSAKDIANVYLTDPAYAEFKAANEESLNALYNYAE